MTNAEKINEFLTNAKVFSFVTTDGDQPKARPFGFHILVDDKVFFGCGTFKDVFKQLTANPKVEVMCVSGRDWLRYDGVAKVVKCDKLVEEVRKANPDLMAMYDKNGWEMGLFYLENGHATFYDMMQIKDEFDI